MENIDLNEFKLLSFSFCSWSPKTHHSLRPNRSLPRRNHFEIECWTTIRKLHFRINPFVYLARAFSGTPTAVDSL